MADGGRDDVGALGEEMAETLEGKRKGVDADRGPQGPGAGEGGAAGVAALLARRHEMDHAELAAGRQQPRVGRGQLVGLLEHFRRGSGARRCPRT